MKKEPKSVAPVEVVITDDGDGIDLIAHESSPEVTDQTEDPKYVQLELFD